MAIKFNIKDGKVFYEVRVESRSRINRDIRSVRKDVGDFALVSETDTQVRLNRLEAKLSGDARLDVSRREGEGILWGDLVERWELEGLRRTGDDRLIPQVSKRTAWSYSAIVRDHTKAWMKKPATSILPSDFGDLLKNMKTLGYSDSSRYNVKVAVNHCFKFGINHRLLSGLAVPPTTGFNISRKESKRPDILTLGEIEKLLEEAARQNHVWYAVWKCALHSGGRSGELYELRRKDIDRSERMIYLERKYNFVTHDIEPLKDGEWRQVPINDELMALFDELDVWSKPAGSYVLPREGRAWLNGEQAKVLRTFCEKIQIRSVCFHALRACWATQLLNTGLEASKVMKMGGWSDWETMMRYIRLAGIEIAGATDKLKFERNERPARVLKLVAGK